MPRQLRRRRHSEALPLSVNRALKKERRTLALFRCFCPIRDFPTRTFALDRPLRAFDVFVIVAKASLFTVSPFLMCHQVVAGRSRPQSAAFDGAAAVLAQQVQIVRLRELSP